MRAYDVDFVAWTEETARAIREERWSDIDRDALIDEVESLGNRDRREVISRLTVLLLHLLKTKYQPERETRSWSDTIEEQRDQLALILDDSPSLRTRIDDLLSKAYKAARRKAAIETGIRLESFPETCEWTAAEVLGQ